jgi:glyoxylase I family protein
MIRSVEHVAIAAKNTEALARWYCDTLGFRVVVPGRSQAAGMGGQGGQGTWFVGPPEGGAVVEIIPAGDAPRTDHAPDDAGMRHIAFTVDDFDAVYNALVAKQVPFTGDVIGAPGERRIAFFTDPEGNLLQLVYRPQPLGT